MKWQISDHESFSDHRIISYVRSYYSKEDRNSYWRSEVSDKKKTKRNSIVT
jgi:hypothetical protein